MNFEYDRLTGDSKLNSVPVEKARERAAIAEHTLAFLESGGRIKHLESFERNDLVFNNQKSTSAIQVKCKRLKAIIEKRGFKDVSISHQPKLQQFYYSIDGFKHKTLGATYEMARKNARHAKL